MVRIGESPYYECSSRGDRRFSAFSAKVGGETIEAQYQAAKILADGRTGLTWREAKGKRAVNSAEVAELYKALWRRYLEDNPDLLLILKDQSGLSDVFGQQGHQCQAITLWELAHEMKV